MQGVVHLQQVTLKAQSHRSIWRDDSLDGLGNIDIVDGFARDFLER